MILTIPLKNVVSYDIPRLLAALEVSGGVYRVNPTAISTIRNYIERHKYPKRLSHARMGGGGYHLSLKAPRK